MRLEISLLLHIILGIYDIYISQNDTDIGDVCRSFSLMENDLSPHIVRFCCDKNMDGEMLTVMKIGNGSLRLFEINVEGTYDITWSSSFVNFCIYRVIEPKVLDVDTSFFFLITGGFILIIHTQILLNCSK